MTDIKTWADFGALTEEERSAYAPEDLEALKTSIAENEANLATDAKKKDEELVKAREIAENQRIRAEKAEKEAKTAKTEKGDGEQSLSTTDVLYLAKADIHEDDLNEVLDWAKFKKVSVSEAHKQLKGTLEVRAEQRRTAEVANTGKTGLGTSKITGESLLEKAETTGEVPEDEEGMRKLFQARMARKLKR